MKAIRESLTQLIRLKWVLMGVGFVAFAGFGVIGAMLRDAGWTRTDNVMAPLAILGWGIAAFGIGLHVYDFIRKNSN
jgi:hypothetical protein